MKKNILFLSVFALALVLGSCDRKADFKSESFATLETVSFSVSEVDGSFTIPVTIYNPLNKEVKVVVKTSTDAYAQEGKMLAEEGVDYEIVSPAGGVLTFAPGEETKNIEVELIHDSEQTGSKHFDIVIESFDESLPVGNYNTASCKIRDKEHPLEAFIGEWTGEAYDLSYQTNVLLNVSIVEDENDETYKKLRIHGLDPIASSMSKVYSLKAVANQDNTAITIASEQPIGYDEVYASYFVFYGFVISSQGVSLENSVTLTYDQKSGGLVFSGAFGSLFTYSDGNQYLGSGYGPGIVLKKK